MDGGSVRISRYLKRGSIPAPLLALGSALVTALLIMVLAAPDPGRAVRIFFIGPFSSSYYFGNMLSRGGLLILAGTGMAVAFRGGTFNLGGEGQVYAGAFSAAMLASALGELPFFLSPGAPLGVLIVLLSSALLGAFIAGISGLLKWLWNVDELIGSFLLGQSIFYLLDYLVIGPARDQRGFLLATVPIPEALLIPSILPPSHLSLAFLLAPAGAILFHRFLFSTWRGYELRICGLNRRFARYGGIETGFYMVLPMLISGGLYGLTGAVSTLGIHGMAIQGATSGLGWNGIAVALIGATNPLMVIPAGLVFAFLEEASATATLSSSITLELSTIVQAVVFLLITIQAGAAGSSRSLGKKGKTGEETDVA